MGPLDGVKVIEIASLAPGPFGCMILSDLGADVLRVDRAERCGPGATARPDPMSRGRRSIGINLKDPDGIEMLLRLAERADVLVEGFRPGVAERLGFGPEVCAARNPRLVFARMTGWGQDGPLADTAGHDIDYIAVSGSLEPIGREGDRPIPPLNLIGDFGGGGMLLVVGVLAALLERERSGQGQVIDVAMVDGSAMLASFLYGLLAAGAWQDGRGTNVLDGARRSTTPTPPPTDGIWRWAPLSPSSTPSCWPGWAWMKRACPPSTTAPAGRSCGPGSPRRSPGVPRHSGQRSSPTRMRAWHPWSARGRRPPTLTTPPVAPSSMSAA